MQAGFFCSSVGTVLVIIALIIHITCLVTPHYSEGDFAKIKDELNTKNLSPQESKLLQLQGNSVKMNWGLWQVCYEVSGEIKDSSCKMWLDEKDGYILDPGMWLKVARGMAILGAVILGKCAIGTVLALIVESRGDRQKYLPYIICAFCFAGGFFSFVGDMIVAGNYKSITNVGGGAGMQLSEGAKDLIGDCFSLGWSFGLDMVVPILACISGVCHLLGRRCSGSGSDITSSRMI